MCPNNYNDEDKRKHLEFVQGAITRMASNCFQMKYWIVVCVTAIIAAHAANENIPYVLAIFPICLFAYLDSRYHRLTRRYESLYNDIVSDKKNVEPYSMSTKQYAEITTWKAFKSWSIKYIYGVPFILIIIPYVIEIIKKVCDWVSLVSFFCTCGC